MIGPGRSGPFVAAPGPHLREESFGRSCSWPASHHVNAGRAVQLFKRVGQRDRVTFTPSAPLIATPTGPASPCTVYSVTVSVAVMFGWIVQK